MKTNDAWFDPEVLAYVAGFFDGEGCISIIGSDYQGYHRWALQTQLAQKRPEVLYQCRDAFGGSVHPARKDGSGGQSWQLSNKKAAAFLWLIRPWLRVKAFETQLALEYEVSRSNLHGIKLSPEELALREGFKLALQAAKRA